MQFSNDESVARLLRAVVVHFSVMQLFVEKSQTKISLLASLFLFLLVDEKMYDLVL